MAVQNITVASRAEHDKVVDRFVTQHYSVELKTESETHLVRDRLVLKEDLVPMTILALCFVVPGAVYYVYLLVRPLPRVIVTIKS